MTIAITGANGFVARNLIVLLLEDMPAGEIRAIVRDPATALRELPSTDLEVVTADVTKPDSLRTAFDGCRAVVHTVAIPTERKATFAAVNARGTEHVGAEAKSAGVRRIVHLSAIGADPESPFPFLRSKGQGERCVIESGIAYVALRPSILFGRGDDFFPKLGFSLRFPVVPVPGDGSARFQPIHVGDVAQVIRAALRGTMTGVHEIAGPDVVTYDELLTETMRGYRKRRPRLHLPVPLMKPAAVAMGLVMADPPVTVAQLDLLKTDNVPVRNAIEQVFGISPRPFRGALGYLSA